MTVRENGFPHFQPVQPVSSGGSTWLSTKKQLARLETSGFNYVSSPAKFNLQASFPPPHLMIFILEDPSSLPTTLLKWQILECFQVIRTIESKFSRPHHGTIGFSSDPTVLMWENYLPTLKMFFLNRIIRYRKIYNTSFFKFQDYLFDELLNPYRKHNNVPKFLKNEQLLESHLLYLNFVKHKIKYPASNHNPPRVYFPPNTQHRKVCYPTKSFVE